MAVVVVLAVLVAGCTDAGEDVPDDGPIAVTVEVLAAEGIAIFGEPGDAAPLAESASPVSPARLLAWDSRTERRRRPVRRDDGGRARLFSALNAVPHRRGRPGEDARVGRSGAHQGAHRVRLIRRHTQHVVHTITYYQLGEDPDGPTAPTVGPIPPDRPQDLTCPFATAADAERLTAWVNSITPWCCWPGDVREGVEVTFTLAHVGPPPATSGR